MQAIFGDNELFIGSPVARNKICDTNSGRILAWGIVPTLNSDDIEKETADSLVTGWEAKVTQLEALGIDRATIMAQSMITPSCGAGSLGLDLAIKVLILTKNVSDRLRSRL